MIALLLLLAADPPTPATALPIGAIARQALPVKGCAAYLFSGGAQRTFVAMASAEPASLRIAIDGTTADYPRTTQEGEVALGLSRSTAYRAGDVTATLDMTITTRSDLTAGALVKDATLRVDRAGKDTVVLPVAGLIGCAT